MSESNGDKRGEAASPAGEGACPSASDGLGALFEPLRSLPDSDQCRIARARELLKQDGYPPDTILLKVARHLANEWPDDPHSGPGTQTRGR